MGEDTEGMVTSTSKLRDLVMGITGFDIMKSETEFKDIYDIIMGIGAEWDNINDIDKAALLEALAGKRQANALAATLQNTEMLAEAYETAENSAGSAMREQANYEKSIQYSLDRFKATGQTALTDIIGSGPIKGAIDAGNVLLGILDKILSKTGMLGPALAAGMAILSRRSGQGLLTYNKGTGEFGGLLSNIPRAATNARESAQIAAEEGATKRGKAKAGIGGFFGTFQRDASLRKENNNIRSLLAQEVRNRDNAWIRENADNIYDKVAEKAGIIRDDTESTRGYIKEISGDLKQTNKEGIELANNWNTINRENRSFSDVLKGGIKSMAAQGAQMAIMMAASVALEAILNKISEKTITFDEAREGTRALIENYHQLRDETNDNIKTAQDLEKEYFNLRKGVDITTNQNRTLSTEDYDRFLDINKQLAEMFPTMVGGYDAQGNAILNLASNVSTLTNEYNKARQAAAKSLIQGDKEAGTGIETFAQAYMNATTETQATNSQAGKLSRLQGAFQARMHSISTNWRPNKAIPNIEVGIDVSNQEAQDAIEHFMEDASGMKDTFEQFGDVASVNSKELTVVAGLLNVSRSTLLDMVGDSDKLNTAIGELQTKQADLKAETEEMVNAGRDYLTAFVQSDEEFYKLTEDTQNIINTIAGNMPQNVISQLFEKGKASGDITGTFDAYMSGIQDTIAHNGSFKSSILDIQRILSDSENLTTANINTVINDLNKLDGKIMGLSSNDLAEMFGADKAIDTMNRFDDRIADFTSGVEEAKGAFAGFNTSEMELFLSSVTDNITDATEALEIYENAAIAARVAQGEIGAHSFADEFGAGSQFATATTAMSDEAVDYGKTYASMKEMVTAADTLRKQGDVGTEQFKSISGMFDAYGRTDVESFVDNLDTLNRYFKDTEHSSQGMLNFLNDLSEKTNESGEKMATLDESTGKWTLSLGDLKRAAEEMGIGYEPFVAMLDELQAKGFTIEHFDNLEDGYQRIGELQAQINQAEAEYAGLVESGASEEALEAQRQKINELKNSYDTAKEAVASYAEEAKASVESATASLDSMLTSAQELATDTKSSDAETATEAKYALISQRNMIQDQLKNMKLEYGDLFNIDDFPDLKGKILDLNKVLEEVFGEEYTLDYTLEGDELNGESTGTMNVTASVVNVMGDAGTGAKDAAEKTKQEAVAKANRDKLTETTGKRTVSPVDISRGYKGAPTATPTTQKVQAQVDTPKIEPVKMKVVTDANEAFATINELEAGGTITFTANVDGVESEVTAVKDQDGNVTYTADIGGVTQEVNPQLQKDGTVDYSANTGGIDAQVEKHLYYHGNIDFSITANIGTRVQTIASNAGAAVRNAINAAKARWAGGSTGTIGGFAGGTIRSFASGSKISIDKEQDAIVNELGEEGLIRDGVMHRIIGGMQQIHLKKGDIIVNHKQMEELEKGEAKSGGGRGRLIGAFAHGTLDGMHAFPEGSGTGGSGSIYNASGSKSSSKSSKSNTKATNDNTKATKSNTDAKDEEKSAAEKLKEEFDGLYDWIEVFIKRTDMWLSRWETQADDGTISWRKQNSYLWSAMELAESAAEDLNASYYKYLAQADASGLSSEYKTKVQQGRKNEIENIESDSELRARVDEYEKWYEKAQDAWDKQIEWQHKVVELENQRIQNIQDWYETEAGYYDAWEKYRKSQQNVMDARGDSRASGAYNTAMTKQYQERQRQSAILNVQAYKLSDEMEIAKKKFGSGSKEYIAAYTKYMDAETAYQDSVAATYELRDAMLENARVLKEWEVDKWSRVLDRVEAAGNYYASRPDSIRNQDANEINTAIQTSTYTQKKIDAIQASISTMRGQLSNYDVNSEQYQSLVESINKGEIEIMNLSADLYKQMGEVFEIYTKRFDQSVEKLQTAIDEAGHVIDLMGTESFVDKSGALTDNGQAGVMLYATMINKNTDAMEDWRNAIKEVNDLRAAGLISEERQNELVSEYTKNIQDAASKNKDYANSLTEIYKTQLQNENEILQDNISKRKEALQAKEDYYNYDRTLRDQNKDIQSLEAQIAALEGTSSAAGQARLLQLQEQLRQAREGQDDTLRQHRNDLISQGYDSLSNNIQTVYDDTLNALETNANFQQEIVANMLNNIVTNYATAYGAINDIIAGTGDVISYTLQSALDTTAKDDKQASRVANRAIRTIDTYDGLGTGGYNNNHISNSTGRNLKSDMQSSGPSNSVKNIANSYAKDATNTSNAGAGGTTVARANQYATASPSSWTYQVGQTKTVTISNGVILGIYDQELNTYTMGKDNKSVTFKGASPGYEWINIATDKNVITLKITTTPAPAPKKTSSSSSSTSKASTPSVSYYPATSPINGSISETLAKAGGYSWEQVKKYTGIRSEVAKANGITNYKGTAAQNIQMLELLKKGKLIRPRKKGGIIDQIIPIKGMLGGDDGLASVQLGEAVLSRPFMQDVVPEFMNTVKQTTKLLQPLGGNSGEVNVHYDSLLTVNGNVDKEALPGLRDLLQQSYEYTSQKMYKDLSKLGFR